MQSHHMRLINDTEIETDVERAPLGPVERTGIEAHFAKVMWSIKHIMEN